MTETAFSSPPRRARRRAAALALAALAGGWATAADAGTVSATYSISIAGIPVGRADANSRIDADGYSIAVRGSTSGLTRLVSDAEALLASNGRISGGQVIPARFELETTENGLSAEVRMTMRGRTVADFRAEPDLVSRTDRVPLTAAHRRDVVDPLSGFLVVLGRNETQPQAACNRTVQIFDGWQRYDVRLSFQRSRTVEGTGDNTYSGPAVVCSARYVPVAGHIASHDAVQYMASNTNLEVWLVPIEGTPVYIPYEIVIGTRIGDLVIRATAMSGYRAAPGG